MNSRVTLAFVLAVALLAGLVFGLEKMNVGGQTPAAGALPTPVEELGIFTFDDQKTTAFVARSGEKSTRFVKQGNEWAIEGSTDPANRVSLTSLLIRMSTLRATNRVEEPGDLKQFGLAEPKLEATAELDDGTKQSLLIGDKTPIGSGYYARKADADDVFVIATQFGTDVERLANDPKEPPTPTPRPSPTPSPTPSGTPTPASKP